MAIPHRLTPCWLDCITDSRAVFAQATYALDVGQLSEPVFSDSGVHLILRTE